MVNILHLSKRAGTARPHGHVLEIPTAAPIRRTARDPLADVEGDALLRVRVGMLRTHMGRLKPDEYAVITLRFGLVGDAWTVNQIAFGLRRSPASIRRIERRAMTKLRLLFGVEEDGDA